MSHEPQTIRENLLQMLNDNLMVMYQLEESGKKSRALSLSITNLEQSIMWLEKSMKQ